MNATPRRLTAPRPGRGDIAIVGMACLFPGADTPARFFANILARLEFLREPRPAWGALRYLGAGGPRRIPTARGGFLGEAFAADPAELGVMPASVDGSEPDQFLALAIAKAALADAGWQGDRRRAGVILGHSTYLHRGNAAMVQHGLVLDQTRELLGQLLPGADPAVLDRIRDALRDLLPRLTADVAPGLVPNVMTGRIANRLDLQGPNYLIDAACASSLLAVQAAAEELRAGRSDLMLAGGVNASLPAEVYMVFHQLGALSASGQLRPFAEGGDGTLLGEGLGILALRRLEDALADGARVYAVIRGLGQSSDGRGAGLLAPRLEGEMLAIERALADAGADRRPPGLIEAHATGIALGDRTEIEALRGVFGARLGNGLPATAIGSVKSMIGHPIPAAGAAGLIKASLALYHRVLPPTLGETPREELRLGETPFYLNTRARPWIAPEGETRRAGVDAFGFGGVNAHALLEQAPGPGAAPTHWPAELLLLAAATPEALARRVGELRQGLARQPEASLAAVAAAAAQTAGDGPARLALVAASRADLDHKLAQALERLEAGRGRFKIRSGVFAAEAPLPGRLAFLFPGEGAQYPGMLAEALIAFPQAREWFDLWDAIFPERELPPSAHVFPPPTTLDPALGRRLEEGLWGLELGSEAMFVAAQALLAVVSDLGLRPDLVLGHSSGEHAALAAAGVLGETSTAAGRAAFAGRIRALNGLYRALAAAGGPGGGDDGALLTVGAIARERILDLVAQDPGLHLALDNCQHQAVLYGARPRMEQVAAEFRAEGGITAFLPFGRPYHTPLFAPLAEKVAEAYAEMGFGPPALPIWSCATAAPMPADPAAIRALAARQWASRVRFTETVERLHDEGVRLFLEIGPSANLAGFVEDALKGRPALALALDSRRRGGLAYLLGSLGQVWVAGRDLDPRRLFARRELRPADLGAAPPRRRPQPIDNSLPYLRLADETAAELSAALLASLGTGRAEPLAPPPATRPAAAAPPPDPPDPPTPAPAESIGTAAALGGYFAVMRRFLDLQAQVMAAAAGRPMAAAPGGWQPPLLHRIAVENASLAAETDIDPLADPFVAQHVLYAAQVSDLDPTLQALPVLPLAVSLEMAAEAAALLAGRAPSRFEEVRARDWAAFDDGPATLMTEAALVPGEGAGLRVAVRIRRDEVVLFEAIAACDEAAPPPPLAPLAAPRAPLWDEAALYTTGMFHGPLFRGVRRLLAWDGDGIDAELGDAPLDGFLAPGGGVPGGLVLNPVLLDQLGQVTAFWIAQGLGTDFSSFPSRIARIDLLDARPEATAGTVLSGRLGFRDAEGRPTAEAATARFLEGDFDATAPDGRPLLRVRGWRDRFLRVPHSFYQARTSPREGWLGGLVADAAAGATLLWALPAFPAGFLEDAGGLWSRVLAATALSRAERAAYAALPRDGRAAYAALPRDGRAACAPPSPGAARRSWLTDRLAAKEAARAFLLRGGGGAVLPADLPLAELAPGRLSVEPWALAALGLGTGPEIALRRVAGATLAAAGPPGSRPEEALAALGGAFAPA